MSVSADKGRMISEAFRVLKPGGRFAVSNLIVRGSDVPIEVRRQHRTLFGLRAAMPGPIANGCSR